MGSIEDCERLSEVLSLIDQGLGYSDSVTEPERQWCIKRGLAEEPGPMITDAQDVTPDSSHDSSTMKPMITLTNLGMGMLNLKRNCHRDGGTVIPS